MAIEVPEIGRWYRDPNGALFEIVAVDAHDGTIEIQHFDGTLEEFDPESWYELQATQTTPPEDWSGSVDVNAEDLPESDTPLVLDWQSALDRFDDGGPVGTE